jgi:hypothetical protein
MSVARFAKSRSGVFAAVIIALLMGLTRSAAATQNSKSKVAAPSSDVQVMLSALHETTSWDEREPGRHMYDLPLVYLHRERAAAAEADRTLEISLSGLSGGGAIQIEVISHHPDISTNAPHSATRRFRLPNRLCTQDEPCVLRWPLDPATMRSDFYHLRVKDASGNMLWDDAYPERPDFAALDTWDLALGRGYAARVYYATLFPFARGENDLENRLPPGAVTDFVEGQFVPIITETWQVQAEGWGFGDPLHPDWDGDRIVEIIVTARPFALFGGTGTYSGSVDVAGRPIPERRVWWLSSLNNFALYDSLEDAYAATFAHEFFHLMQWNVRLSSGRPESYWLNLFVEAQASLAASVQYPEIEMVKAGRGAQVPEFVRAANHFLTQRLNTSYAELEADPAARYDFALYWRFLYEQLEDMAVLRAGLEEMARHRDAGSVSALRAAMDATLSRFDGPYRTFEESVVAFARANYALRLENGRCTEETAAECGALYRDPDAVYLEPPLEAVLDYGSGDATGDTGLTYTGAIPSSYGMDFIDLRLDPALNGQPLRLRLEGKGEGTRFSLQVWQLGPGPLKPRAITREPEIAPRDQHGTHLYVIPQVDARAYYRLALIITRLDPGEATDAGAYSIVVDSSKA